MSMHSTGPTPNCRAHNAWQQLSIARYITRFRALRRTLVIVTQQIYGKPRQQGNQRRLRVKQLHPKSCLHAKGIVAMVIELHFFNRMFTTFVKTTFINIAYILYPIIDRG